MQLIVLDPRSFRAVRTAVEILVAVRDLFPRAIDVSKPALLDRDWGTDSLRLGLTAGKSAGAILAQWTARTADFTAMREKYLLY